jgi:hypothetical protein
MNYKELIGVAIALIVLVFASSKAWRTAAAPDKFVTADKL